MQIQQLLSLSLPKAAFPTQDKSSLTSFTCTAPALEMYHREGTNRDKVNMKQVHGKNWKKWTQTNHLTGREYGPVLLRSGLTVWLADVTPRSTNHVDVVKLVFLWFHLSRENFCTPCVLTQLQGWAQMVQTGVYLLMGSTASQKPLLEALTQTSLHQPTCKGMSQNCYLKQLRCEVVRQQKQWKC